jgi:hypothetical protein
MDTQTPVDTIEPQTEQPQPEPQTVDTPGHDENGDGLDGGQATADTVGDVLGI